MQPTRTFSITAPGFAGLNTQDAPVDMDSKFALEATNCVIDKFGRVGSRKGWLPSHTTNTDLGSSDILVIDELVSISGDKTILAAGNNKLFKLVSTTLTTLTYGGGGIAPVVTASNWQTCVLNDAMLFFQEGHDSLIYDIGLSTTQYRRLSEHPTYSGTAPLANCAISAYGRVWAARTTTDKNTLAWTDTLTHQKWTGGTAGYLNLQGVWPIGGDEIVGLAAHNNMLIIFGSKQILIYAGANNPSTMTLSDSIGNCGCVARDSIQNTPNDIIFLSTGGVRSIARTIQEKSAPLTVVSRTVNDDILLYITNENDANTIKAVYSPTDSFYLLTFAKSLVTYCFDMRVPLPDGSSRATVWVGLVPKCYGYATDRTLYMGTAGYVTKYTGYLDNTSTYRLSYYTSWADFGDSIRTSILKKISSTIYGAVDQTITYKWGFDYVSQMRSAQVTTANTATSAEYSISEYGIGEYTDKLSINTVTANVGGSGKTIQLGVECIVNGLPISIQRIDIYTKDGAFK